MRAAECNRICGTEFAMVTTTTFGNVMEQGSQIDDVTTGQTLKHRTDYREFLGEFRFLKAVQVA